MDFKMNPQFEAQMAAQIQQTTQAAVDATSRAHHEQGEQDVAGRLRSEMSQRGVNITDDGWLAEMADNIRGGQVVIVSSEEGAEEESTEANEPTGGDNIGA